MTTSDRDAFGRFRISESYIIGENSSETGKNPIFIDELLIGNGTSTETTKSYIEMKVFNENDKVVRQSKKYFPYQPGKSKLILISGVLNKNNSNGFISRIGSYDDNSDKNNSIYTNDIGGNGHFFQLEDGILSVVERNSFDNSNTDIIVPQSNWNIDKFDGTGISNRKISDLTKILLFVIDLEWLGVGIVRMGFIFDGIIYYCHYFSHDHLDTPYTRTARLPIRYEINKKTNTDTIGEMRMLCFSVISESGFRIFGKKITSKTGNTSITVNKTPTAVLSLKLKNTHFRQNFKIINFDFISLDNRNLYYEVILNPTLTNSNFTIDPNINSNVIMDTTKRTYTLNTGLVLRSGFIFQKTTSSILMDDIDIEIPANANINGTSDIIAIVVNNLTNNDAIFHLNVEWIEY
jgi:hypothetical protein